MEEVNEELRNENDGERNDCVEVKNVIDTSEKEKLQNGSGDNGESQPLKIKSKVSLESVFQFGKAKHSPFFLYFKFRSATTT